MSKRIIVGSVSAVLLFGWLAAAAVEVAGVDIPDQVTPAGSEQTLLLNGAGIRKKFFFKIYIGALYLQQKSRSAEAVMAADGAKRVLMHFLYGKVSQEDLVEAWREGFRDNLNDAEQQQLQPQIEQFVGMFRELREGESVWLDYLPASGTRVSINGEVVGRIAGAAFYPALLRIWLGEEPVTDDLKRSMLGGG